MTKYCMDCGHYVAGGKEKNCAYPWPRRQFADCTVSALKEACSNYMEKHETEDLSFYPKIDLRARRSRKFKKDKQ